MERFNTTYNVGILLIFVISGFSVYFIFKQMKLDTSDEGFKISNPVETITIPVVEEVIGEKFTTPTSKNPFMNVLIDQIKYNPTRAAALSVLDPEVTVTLDQFFKTNFTSDPTDVFGRSQSQRQFYVTPSTTVPNDVESYQNWLYRIPGKTCKEGGREACSMASGSAGSQIPWLSEN
jgi:hypothetical protein|uniref:Uncharacterized protein n=1 Tax=viral metagenome TaxID=1070528 RepID=A0A6C0IFT0_9ZZZZ